MQLPHENATPHECLALALNSKFGILVEVSDITAFKARLYVERKSDPDFNCLSIHNSPAAPDTQLFIVRKENAS